MILTLSSSVSRYTKQGRLTCWLKNRWKIVFETDRVNNNNNCDCLWFNSVAKFKNV